MTIRRQWLFALTVTAVLAVCINSLLLGTMMNRYFLNYSSESYQDHVAQLEQLSKKALLDGGLTTAQVSMQLESHLDDPIVNIKLYDAGGRLLGQAGTQAGTGMMPGMMGNRMRQNAEEVDSITLTQGQTTIGFLHITRYATLSHSLGPVRFLGSLVRSAALSFGIVLVVVVLMGLWVSRRLSRDLRQTAAQALAVDMGESVSYRPSKVREVRILQASLQELRNRLNIRQTARKRALDELVHQTRTPLTILQTHLEGVADGVLSMDAPEIAVCREQVDSMEASIANISTLLDAELKTDAPAPEPVDLAALLRQIIRGLKVQFDQKGVTLILQDDLQGKWSTDRYKLSQCVYNLLNNAYKYTAAGGSVVLACQQSGQTVTLSVCDTGPGIAPEDLAHLFDAYYRGQGAGAIPGDGLGLYVVRENMRQLGGNVQVHSVPGQGSEFILTLPQYNSGRQTTEKQVRF